MKAQTEKDKQETMNAQQPSQGRGNWKTDNLSSVVIHQSGKRPSACLRETQLNLQMKGDWKLGSCWEVQTQLRGFLWGPDLPLEHRQPASCSNTNPLAVVWRRRQRLHTLGFAYVFLCTGLHEREVKGHRDSAWPWVVTRTLGGKTGFHCSLLLPPNPIVNQTFRFKESWAQMVDTAAVTMVYKDKQPAHLCQLLQGNTSCCILFVTLLIPKKLCFHRDCGINYPNCSHHSFTCNTVRRTQTSILRYNCSRGLKQGKAGNSRVTWHFSHQPGQVSWHLDSCSPLPSESHTEGVCRR